MNEDGVGQMEFFDEDMPPEMYNKEDPDGSYGVFNDEKTYKPNGASMLRELKAQILKVAEVPPLNVAHLRPLTESCDKVADSTLDSDVTVVGQHLLDCVNGQLYKTLIEVVKPHFQKIKGDIFAAFAIRQAAEVNDVDGQELADEARNVLALSQHAMDTASNFTSMSAYSTCKNLQPHDQTPKSTAS